MSPLAKNLNLACSHCHLSFPKDSLLCSVIGGREEYFCCKGCEGVYYLLHQEGLDDFYDKLGTQTLNPVSQIDLDLSHFDSKPFYDRYVQERDGFLEVALIIQKIHCIACVWLNEKILAKQLGIIEVNVHYTNNKAKIIFDPAYISVSQIIKTIQSIGYDAHFYDPRIQEQLATKEKREYYIKLAVGIFCVMNIMWIAIAQYAGYFSGMNAQMRDLLNFVGFLLSAPVLFFTGASFWGGAYFALKHKQPNMDLLVTTGASLTFFYSIYASFYGGETYFESVAMIITFVFVGKFLEVRGKKMAIDCLDGLTKQIPMSIKVQRDGKSIEIDPYLVEVGEIVEVSPGDRIALDGLLLSNVALCDEGVLSGESLPIQKQQGDCIYSGSLALGHSFLYQTKARLQDSMMGKLVGLIEEALKAKPKIQELTQHITRYFSVIILGLGGLTFWCWYGLLDAGFERALVVCVSLIVIACPCALALAVPIASLVGLSQMIGHKILFKRVRALEGLACIDVLIFDKTGTITQGQLGVVQSFYFDMDEQKKAALLALVGSNSHPISLALCEYLHAQKMHHDIKQIPARGVRMNINGEWYMGGNFDLLEENGIVISEDLKQQARGGSVFCFANSKALLALFVLKDTIKADAREAILAIGQMGVEVMLVSGDHQWVCQEVAKEVGITQIHHSQTPLSKADLIDALHKEGKRVGMVGDGINDSLALSKSDVSFAMGGGIDLAIDVSDVVLLDNRVMGVSDALKIAKRTLRIMKQNLLGSLVYNSIMIPLAMLGFVIPLIAALSMSLSSVLVVGNSLRIKDKLEV